MISFSEGLGALEFQMLVYKKVYQGLSVHRKAGSPIALFGLFSCSLGRKPSGETMWDQELRLQRFLNPPSTKAFSKVSATSGGRQRLNSQDFVHVTTPPALRAILVPIEPLSQECSFNTPGKHFGPLMCWHDTLRRVTEFLPAKRNDCLA